MAPEYLRHLIPPTIQSTTIYPLRYGDNLIVPFCRLSINNSSFIPYQLRQIAYAEKQIISYFRKFGTNKKEVIRIFLGGTAATRWVR
jgi:hypothetical protein